MWPDIEPVTKESVAFKEKFTYMTLVNHIHNLQLDNQAIIDCLKEKIPEFIDIPSNRCDGLLFMENLLKTNPEIYIHNWGKIVCGTLEHVDSIVSKELALNIFNLLVMNCSQECANGTILTVLVPKVVPLLLQLKNEGFVYACQSLSICMKHVPEMLTSHLVEIEKFLLNQMCSMSTETIEVIADCFAALPKCYLHFKNLNPKYYSDVWLEVFSKTLNTMDDLLNRMEFSSDVINTAECAVFDINVSDFAFLTVSRIFSSLCRCLAKMLSTDVDVVVRIPVEHVLRCLTKIFKPEIFSKHSNHKMSLLSLSYPLMYNAVYVIFEALILNVNILDQSRSFVHILERSLNVAAAGKYCPYTIWQIKCVTWRIINVWLSKYGTKGVYEIARSELLFIELKSDVESKEDKNLKAGQKIIQKKARDAKAACCAEALKALKNIFLYGAEYLEKQNIESMSTVVINIVRKVQLYLNTPFCPFPYHDRKCRKRLYDLLFACSAYVEPMQSKNIVQAIGLFRIATKDPASEVTAVCQKAFRLYRHLVNPKKPPPDITLQNRRDGGGAPSRFSSRVPSLVELEGAFVLPTCLIGNNAPPPGSSGVHLHSLNTYHEEYENGHEGGQSTPMECSVSPGYAAEAPAYPAEKPSSSVEEHDSDDGIYCEEPPQFAAPEPARTAVRYAAVPETSAGPRTTELVGVPGIAAAVSRSLLEEEPVAVVAVEEVIVDEEEEEEGEVSVTPKNGLEESDEEEDSDGEEEEDEEVEEEEEAIEECVEIEGPTKRPVDYGDEDEEEEERPEKRQRVEEEVEEEDTAPEEESEGEQQEAETAAANVHSSDDDEVLAIIESVPEEEEDKKEEEADKEILEAIEEADSNGGEEVESPNVIQMCNEFVLSESVS